VKRDLAPEEVAEIAALAADFPDIRQIRPLIAELRSVGLDAVIVRPRSVSDLIDLFKAKLVEAEWCRIRLGIQPAAEDATEEEEPAPDATPPKLEVVEPDYVIRDRRAGQSA
jgi:hypothetical protein